jgi:arabinan endo-1,5-alpha-L-arabinosidase
MPTRNIVSLISKRSFVMTAMTVAIVCAAGAGPAGAAGHPLPVLTSTGKNYDTPDPGVLLDGTHFYGFATGSGLREWSAPTSAGAWTAPPVAKLSGGLPSWADSSKAVWAPDMIKTTSGSYIVYFSAALKGTSGGAGSDSKPASGARCIGTAHGTSANGTFTANQQPLVCFSQYGPADPMMADPGNRVRGEGVIDASPAFVTIDGAKELFLLYKTQGDPGNGQIVTIRMARLSASDGTTVLGDSHQLLFSGTGSFADTIEAPSLIQHGSYFILFVAHGNFGTCNYSTEWFKSQHIWAWTNNAGTTLLNGSSTSGMCGPGSADVTGSQVAGQDRIFFHAWVKITTNPDGTKTVTTTPFGSGTPDENVSAARVMYAAVLTFGSDGFTPVLGAFQGQ